MTLFGRKSHTSDTDRDSATNTASTANERGRTASNASTGQEQNISPVMPGSFNDPRQGGLQPQGHGLQSHGQSGSAIEQTGIQQGPDPRVGSSAIREQSLRKEQEAKALQSQSEDIMEAERLEQAAREHRERAFAAGAHPANRELGAGNHLLSGGNISED
ncbi:hypothetical protein ABKN59_009673 [Abortiporus biennis]